MSFSSSTNSQSFFVKISGIGPWESRINVKGIDVPQPVQLKLKKGVKSIKMPRCTLRIDNCFLSFEIYNVKMHFYPFFEFTYWEFEELILKIGRAGKWHFFGFCVIGFFEKKILFLFLPIKISLAFLWGIIYFSALWMVSSEFWKRLHPNQYPHNAQRSEVHF